jgi:hypothetical protein
MSITPSSRNNIALQCIAVATIACSYLFYAPNYEWTEQAFDTPYGADFMQEWVGARILLSPQASQLYQTDLFRECQYDSNIVGFEWQSDQFFPPVYPPPHYALFSPLACLPYRWAVVVWLLVLIACAFASARLIQEIVVHHARETKNQRMEKIAATSSILWVGLLLFPSLLFSITLGQKSVGWLLIACMTWRLLQMQRDFVSGMVFGLLSIKPTLFFLFPLVMLRQRRWSFFCGASASVIALWERRLPVGLVLQLDDDGLRTTQRSYLLVQMVHLSPAIHLSALLCIRRESSLGFVARESPHDLCGDAAHQSTYLPLRFVRVAAPHTLDGMLRTPTRTRLLCNAFGRCRCRRRPTRLPPYPNRANSACWDRRRVAAAWCFGRT